jgi:N-acetylmuramoyl-L-alanine amidase
MRWTERLISRRASAAACLTSVLFAAALSLVFVQPSTVFAQQPPAVPPPPGKPDLPALPPPPKNPSVQPAFSVVIDAAHGGANTGARIAANLLESDLNLALAARLRAALTARGVTVVSTRESDADIPFNQRAGIANHALAAACLVLHTTATGSGIHLFTSSLAPVAAQSPLEPSQMVPWQTAQAAWVTRSLRLASAFNSALGQAGIPVTLGSTSLEPLDHLTCPAVAIEIAPLAASRTGGAMSLADPKYQQRILDAIIAALQEWSTDWKQQP